VHLFSASGTPHKVSFDKHASAFLTSPLSLISFQGWIFAAAADHTPYKQANVYLGACMMVQNEIHSWYCRLCSRAGQVELAKSKKDVPEDCFNGGQDQYKEFYKIGWRQNGTNGKQQIAFFLSIQKLLVDFMINWAVLN
jgi:hypothetical protein